MHILLEGKCICCLSVIVNPSAYPNFTATIVSYLISSILNICGYLYYKNDQNRTRIDGVIQSSRQKMGKFHFWLLLRFLFHPVVQSNLSFKIIFC